MQNLWSVPLRLMQEYFYGYYICYIFPLKKIEDSLVTNKKPYFKDGTVIVESILTIKDVELKNSGLFTCKSVSRFDQSKSAEASSIINVQGMCVLDGNTYTSQTL